MNIPTVIIILVLVVSAIAVVFIFLLQVRYRADAAIGFPGGLQLPGAPHERRPATDEEVLKDLALSFSHPKRIAKGHSARFMIILYQPALMVTVDDLIRKSFPGVDYEVYRAETPLRPGVQVVVELYSPTLVFGPPAKLALSARPTRVDFVGTPTDSCIPGEQTILLSIRDLRTDLQYLSEAVSVSVVDYAFDHVSRPKLQMGLSLVSAIGAIALWALTFFGQIDTTLGLTAGTAVAAFSGFWVMRVQQLYQAANATMKFSNQP